MKLTYTANARIPSEKAHPYQILKMCEAFEENNTTVKLIVPARFETQKKMKQIKDIWKYYALSRRFKIKRLPSIDFLWTNPYYPSLPWLASLTFRLQDRSFGILATIYAIFSRSRVIYTRDFFVCFLLAISKILHRKKVYFEEHMFGLPYGKKISFWALKKIDGLIVTTGKLKELYIKNGMPREKLLVAADGFDPRLFTSELPKIGARRELSIPEGKKVVCYTGHLYRWKGAHVLAQSRKYLPDDCLVYIVGGTDIDIGKFKEFLSDEKIEGIVLTGYVAPTLVPKYLAASDVVVLPNTSGAAISSYYTSPLKLFEYMASRRPIVASNLPSIAEILDDQNAVLVEPDNPKALADGIKRVLQNQELADKIADKAYRDGQQYTWQKRAERILAFIGGDHSEV